MVAVNAGVPQQAHAGATTERAPMELLTGLAPKTVIDQIAWLGADAKVTSIDVSNQQLRAPLASVHKALRPRALGQDSAITSQAFRAVTAIPQTRTATTPTSVTLFSSPKSSRRTSKLQMTWTGPHEVIDMVSPFVYIVRPKLRVPMSRKPKTVHIVCIRRFSACALATDADKAVLLEKAALKDYPDNVVDKFISRSFGHGPAKPLLIRVRWLGFDSAHDTHEPASNLVQDVPDMVEEYLREHKHNAACSSVTSNSKASRIISARIYFITE